MEIVVKVKCCQWDLWQRSKIPFSIYNRRLNCLFYVTPIHQVQATILSTPINSFLFLRVVTATWWSTVQQLSNCVVQASVVQSKPQWGVDEGEWINLLRTIQTIHNALLCYVNLGETGGRLVKGSLVKDA